MYKQTSIILQKTQQSLECKQTSVILQYRHTAVTLLHKQTSIILQSSTKQSLYGTNIRYFTAQTCSSNSRVQTYISPCTAQTHAQELLHSTDTYMSWPAVQTHVTAFQDCGTRFSYCRSFLSVCVRICVFSVSS